MSANWNDDRGSAVIFGSGHRMSGSSAAHGMDRVSSTGEKVLSWSQSALFSTAVFSEIVYGVVVYSSAVKLTR